MGCAFMECFALVSKLRGKIGSGWHCHPSSSIFPFVDVCRVEMIGLEQFH